MKADIRVMFLQSKEYQKLPVYFSLYSGFYNKMPSTGKLSNNRNLFLTVLEAGKSILKFLANSVSGEGLFPDL
jgi:hypothetical protein